MKRGKGYRLTLKSLSWTGGLAAAALTAINAISKIDPLTVKEHLSSVEPLYATLRVGAPLWSIGLLILGTIVRKWIKWLGPPWLWAYTQGILDEYQKQLFKDRQLAEIGYHRVTLFRYTPWCLRRWWVIHGGGWLVPVQRSGHTSQKSSTVFRVPDAPDKCEGIAGRAWARRSVVAVDNLPDVSKNPSDQAIETYARLTGMDQARVRRMKPPARSLVGMPIDTKKGVWGVLVMDSREPETIKWQAVKIRKLTELCADLGKLLEGSQQ